MARVIAIVSDLIFSSRIAAAARDADLTCRVLRSPSELPEAVTVETALVIVDLEAPGITPAAITAAIGEHAPSARIVSFLPHVRADLASASRAAGIDRVLARSAFVDQLPALLAAARSANHEDNTGTT